MKVRGAKVGNHVLPTSSRAISPLILQYFLCFGGLYYGRDNGERMGNES